MLIGRWCSRYFAWARSHPWPVVLIIALVVLVPLVWAAWDNWDWLTKGESGSAAVRNLGLVVIAVIALPLAIWRSMVAHSQAATAQHGLLNERYQKGAEMLGSYVLSVRLGGIYALGRLAEEHPAQYHPQIMRLICAFIRNPTRDDTTDSGAAAPIGKFRVDVQAALTLIGERGERGRQIECEIQIRATDLSGAVLKGAKMSDLNLQNANLEQVKLSNASLDGADMSEATLWRANLSAAGLVGAKMDRAWLAHANLSGTNFSGRGFFPATGLTQDALDEARADPENPPDLTDVLDAKTNEPLVWRGKSLED